MEIFRRRYIFCSLNISYKYECYERYYDVSAHSENEAEEKLKEDIANGRENQPEECYNSGAEVVGNGEIEI